MSSSDSKLMLITWPPIQKEQTISSQFQILKNKNHEKHIKKNSMALPL